MSIPKELYELRNPTYELLSKTEISDVAKPQPRIVTIDSNATIQEAIKVLAENKILSVPVMSDKEGQFIGFFDLLDVVAWIVKKAGPAPTASDLTTLHLSGQSLGNERASSIIDLSDRNPFEPLTQNMPANGLVELFAVGIHRVPLYASETDYTVKQIVSQSDLCRYLLEHSENPAIKSFLNLPACTESNKLGEKLVTASKTETVLEVLRKMNDNLISAVPVLDSDGTIVASFSATCLRGLPSVEFGDFLLPLDKFLERRYPSGFQPLTASEHDTMECVIRKMVGKQGVSHHRVWVVNQNKKPIGVISMTDIMKSIRDTELKIGSNLNFIVPILHNQWHMSDHQVSVLLPMQRQTLLPIAALVSADANRENVNEKPTHEEEQPVKIQDLNPIDVIAGWRAGLSLSQIAETLRSLPKYIEGKIRRIRNGNDEILKEQLREATIFRKKAKGTYDQNWTKEQVEKLIYYKSENLSNKQIAEMLGKTPKAVERKWHRVRRQYEELSDTVPIDGSLQIGIQQTRKRKRNTQEDTDSVKRQKTSELCTEGSAVPTIVLPTTITTTPDLEATLPNWGSIPQSTPTLQLPSSLPPENDVVNVPRLEVAQQAYQLYEQSANQLNTSNDAALKSSIEIQISHDYVDRSIGNQPSSNIFNQKKLLTKRFGEFLRTSPLKQSPMSLSALIRGTKFIESNSQELCKSTVKVAAGRKQRNYGKRRPPSVGQAPFNLVDLGELIVLPEPSPNKNSTHPRETQQPLTEDISEHPEQMNQPRSLNVLVMYGKRKRAIYGLIVVSIQELRKKAEETFTDILPPHQKVNVLVWDEKQRDFVEISNALESLPSKLKILLKPEILCKYM